MDDFTALQSDIQSSLVSTTRAASTLSNEDLPFHRSLSSQLAANLDRQNARLLGLASGLLATATSAEETVRRAPSLKDLDAIDGNWRAVVDVVDSLLERADTALDEFTGAVRRLSPGVAEKATPSKQPPKMSRIATQLKAQDMEKPQLRFDHVPTNHESGPFKPLLLSKPHATYPLETEPIATDELSQQQYPHPYQLEIEQYRYPASVYTRADPIPYHPFDSMTATLVDSEEAVEEMLEELKQASEIAIDLEHHDQRSYVGIVCLMQISTRNKDWIVDTLKPWRRKLQCLNQVFADPNIVKVLHGAYMDIMWLQRDLGLYVVGLFDTHYAARALGYAGGSLAFLLKKFANVDAQKQYQMADWRIRPLPQELFDYARSDTHYLLYIYDCMRNELIQRSNFCLPDRQGDKLNDVLVRSSETALQRYEYPIYDTELGQGGMGWYKLISRTAVQFTKEQFSVFRALHRWRDAVAREQDDSLHYVMPNYQIFSLAREIPTNRAAVIGMCQPTTQTVRLRADELVGVIIKAKEDGKEGPELVDVLNKIEPRKWRSAIAKAEEPSVGVANFVPAKVDGNALVNGAGVPVSISSLVLRSVTSTFWGGAFPSSVHDQRRPVSTAADVSMTVPMPALTAEVFAEPTDFTPSTPVQSTPNHVESSSPAQPQEEEEEEADDTFVLKNMKRKRRLVANIGTKPPGVDDVAAQTDEVDLSNEGEALANEKIERKKAKREAKRLKKLEREGKTDVNGTSTEVDGEEEPFDYASAPSILHPPRDEEVGGRGGKRDSRKKQAGVAGMMDSRRAMDTPKGLPRAQKERAGRSMTYMS